MLKTIIVEDKLHDRDFLVSLLTEFCPNVQIIALAVTKDEAIDLIASDKPGLVFFDIELLRESSVSAVNDLVFPGCHIVFTTEPGHPSIKAMQLGGIDHLLKPIDSESLQAIINNALEKKDSILSMLALKHLYTTLQTAYIPEHLYIPNIEGGEYAAINDIIRIEIIDQDPIFFLRSGTSYPSIHSLDDYEILLEDLPFFRVHPAHIINLQEIAGILQYPKDIIEMSDSSLVPLSPERKNELAAMQSQLARVK